MWHYFRYGYTHNGYQYDPPKFMFYPYSQQNIASKPSNNFLNGDGKTEVTIEPSYSYELQPQSYITQNEPQIDVPKAENPHAEQHQHYEEPVIVLRIPGPAKYATHLQMLLQQYLEIRAAQYLRILEEAEQRNNQLQQIDHGQPNTEEIGTPIEHIQQQIGVPEKVDYNQQVQYDHQIAITPQPIQYPDIDNVYHNYKHVHSANQGQFPQQPQDEQSHYSLPQSDLDQHRSQYEEDQQYEHQSQQYQPQSQQQLRHQQEEQPQLYYTHQQYAQPEAPPANTYQNVYLLSMTPQSNSEYNAVQGLPEKQQPIYVQDQSDQNDHTQALPIIENNPRPSHTKVVFTTNNEHIHQEYQMYRLPSIKPNERHPATSVPDHHQDFRQQYQHLQTNEEQHYNIPEPNTQEVVTITQRPFNYHAHNVKARAKGRTAHKRRAVTTEEADHGLQKIREYVREKLGGETGSAVEFKTTQLLDG